MTIWHVVQYEFKPTATQEQVDQACRGMLALKDECLHPTTKKPYIKSAFGGKDNNPLSYLSGGLTHVFLSEFESEEDRNYYLQSDPAHREYGEFLLTITQTIRVMDFEPGKF